jgi:hypothetical protein
MATPIRSRSSRARKTVGSRVGVGRFASVQNALSVLQDMNGILPEGAWLLKMTEADEDAAPAEASASTSAPSDPSESGRSV